MNEKSKNGHLNLGNTAFMPKEELLDMAVKHRKISIGVPNDKKNDEKRVALTPEAVNLLVETGNEVIVQKGAGSGANYSDKDYADNGALISDFSIWATILRMSALRPATLLAARS